jgi:uncharacterized membrane protein
MPSPLEKSSFTDILRSGLRALPSNLHWVFLLFAIPQVIFLAFWTPPFQTADEPAHFDRACQIAQLQIGAHFGGFGDKVVDRIWNDVAGMEFHPDVRYTEAEQSDVESTQWTGQLTYREFPNTGDGAFIGYIPQALGIVIGKVAGLGPLRTLELARLLNGAFGVAVCAVALWWAKSGKLVMFILLLMPMSLSLFASCGQDATLIALTCVAFATISKHLDLAVPLSHAETVLVVTSLTVVSVGRPPYVALLSALLVPLLFSRRRNRPSWITGSGYACLSFAVTATWWLVAMHATRAVAKPIAGIGLVDPKMQLTNLFFHPGIVAGLLSYAAHHTAEYIAGVIGYLGWLDTLMPPMYYLAMILVLVLAGIGEMSYGPRCAKTVTVLFSIAGIAGIFAVFLVEYLIWTPVGAPGIYGVQGRYFVPLIVATAVGLPRLDNSARTYERVTAILVAAQLITVLVLPKVILARYYGG